MKQLEVMKKFYYKQIRKTPPIFPTSLPIPNTQISTPITYFCNNNTFILFQEVESPARYVLNSRVCSNLEVEVNILNGNCTLTCELFFPSYFGSKGFTQQA